MEQFNLINAQVANNCFKAIHDKVAECVNTERTVVVTIEVCTQEKARTLAQNSLQRKWLSIAEKKDKIGWKAEDYRAYCKLHFGVPILRAENPEFRVKYDEIVKPLDYERKLAIMAEPLNLPVTRLMSKRQKKQFLDEMYNFLTVKCGFDLSENSE